MFDEIVEPQTDSLARANLPGAVNIQIQDYCSWGTFAGGPNLGHENALYNPVAVANVLDALKHSGQADPHRAGPYDCSLFKASGFTIHDIFATEFLIPLAGWNILIATNGINAEPPLKPYVT